MKLVVLTGLVAFEKIQLAAELAQAFPHARIIDNVARLAMDSEIFAKQPERITGDILPELPALLAQKDELMILAASEEVNPHALVATLDRIAAHQPDLEVVTIALIDLRTCDCFPNLRQAFEEAADIAVMMPYNLAEIVNYVA